MQNAAPDLSAVDEPLTDSTGLPNPFDKGSGGIPRASDITELAARAKKEVRGCRSCRTLQQLVLLAVSL